MKKKIYLSWYCAECKKSGIAEVELPTKLAVLENIIDKQHPVKCQTRGRFVEIRNVEVAVK